MNRAGSLPKKDAMPSALRAILQWIVVFLLAGALPAVPASAQWLGRSAQNPDDPSMSVEVGLGGEAWPGRWIPLNVTLQGGAKPFDGIVTVAYSQDDINGAQIVRSVAATPGKPSTFTTLVNLPADCAHLEITLRNRDGREVRRMVMDSVPDFTRGQASLPRLDGTRPIVVGLGDAGSASLGTVRQLGDLDEDRPAIGVAHPRIVMLSPAQLPPTWAALDSALLLVVTGDAARACDARAVAGVREWVSAGGSLVILADEPGEAWRDWLTPGGAGEVPVTVGGAQRDAVPDALAGALATQVPQLVRGSGARAQQAAAGVVAPIPTPAVKAAPQADDPKFAPAPRLSARPLTLTPAGVAAGWRVRYSVAGDDPTGLLAEGPFGFGYIVVIGFDPQRVAGVISGDGLRRVWWDVLSEALSDWRNRKPPGAPPGMPYFTDQYSTGGLTVTDMQMRVARAAALERISDIPAIGSWVFPILAGGLFCLAVLLGPVDALTLRALKARHRSWATALGWITLATLAAYYVPNWVRSGETRINRLSVVDAVQLEPTAQSPVLAWRTAQTGVFAGKTIQQAFEGEIGGSWWRATATQREMPGRRGEGSKARRTLLSMQAMPDLTALALEKDPWGGLKPGAAGAGGNILAPTVFGLWTFRSFQDQARADTPLRAVVWHDDTGANLGWRVVLSGVPEGARVSSASLRVAGANGRPEEWFGLNFQSADGKLATATTGDGSTKTPRTWGTLGTDDAQQQNYYYWGPMQSERQRHGLLMCLAGPDRREAGIARAVRTGRAVVYLALTGMPADIRLATPATFQHDQVCRLVVPIVPTEVEERK